MEPEGDDPRCDVAPEKVDEAEGDPQRLWCMACQDGHHDECMEVFDCPCRCPSAEDLQDKAQRLLREAQEAFQLAHPGEKWTVQAVETSEWDLLMLRKHEPRIVLVWGDGTFTDLIDRDEWDRLTMPGSPLERALMRTRLTYLIEALEDRE